MDRGNMNTVDVITRKRDGFKLEADEIRYMVEGYTQGDIPDYQMAAMLMAIVAHKLNKPLNELRFKSIKEVK